MRAARLEAAACGRPGLVADFACMQTAFITNSVMTAVSITFCFILRYFLKRANTQMDREEAEYDDEKEANSDGVSRIAPVTKKIRYVL